MVLVVFVVTRFARASCWIALAVHVSAANAQTSEQDDAIYAYIDDRGQLVHVQRLQDIPISLRESARRVDEVGASDHEAGGGAPASANKLVDWLTGKEPSSDREPVVYRYIGTHGRPVFTNLASSVPTLQRGRAKVDLRHVSLNSELGAAINQNLERRYDELRASSACHELRAESNKPWWARAWRDNRPLVVCAGVLALLLLGTPWMHKRGVGRPWARVLGTAVPVLGFVGLSAFLLVKAEQQMQVLAPRAERCDKATWQGTGDLPKRFALVSALEAEQATLNQIMLESR